MQRSWSRARSDVYELVLSMDEHGDGPLDPLMTAGL